MRKFCFYVLLVVISGGLGGCAITVPTGSYIPQNYVRYENSGSVEVGPFVYLPLTQGKVKKANELKNTALGTIHISSDVAEFVRRATALEFEKTGLQIKDSSNLLVTGEIIEFTMDALGYSIDLIYSVKYIIRDKSTNSVLHSKVYTPSPKKAGKFGTADGFTENLNEQVVAGYDMFIRDQAVRAILDRPASGAAGY